MAMESICTLTVCSHAILLSRRKSSQIFVMMLTQYSGGSKARPDVLQFECLTKQRLHDLGVMSTPQKSDLQVVISVSVGCFGLPSCGAHVLFSFGSKFLSRLLTRLHPRVILTNGQRCNTLTCTNILRSIAEGVILQNRITQ